MTARRTLFFLGLSGLAGCTRSAQPRLNVFNWSNYVAPDTIPRFEAETGARVRYSVYESNEEMFARVLSGNSGWDVVFPTNYYVPPMRDLGLLQPVDALRLTGLNHLEPSFQSPEWDPGLRWCVPYMWGATGILYDPAFAPEPTRWADLWQQRWSGRLTMLDDPAEVLGAALKKNGLSVNATHPDQLRLAQRDAIRQKHLLRAYLNAEVRDQAVAGDVAACQVWSTTAQQAMDAAPRLRFVYPMEGFPLYADCAVILRESRRGELAHRFIDYLLRPEIAASILSASRTATANRHARLLLPSEARDLPTLYPAAATLARGEWFRTLPPQTLRLRDRLWTEIKSS
jgi:spermidine/putrescine-binding protein